MLKKRILPWLPAVLMMAVIFGFSSTPSTKLPNFGLLDGIVKKGGHMLGYGLLALAYWVGLRFEKRRWWLALLLAVIYAVTDEFHQSFVPGRHPSAVDVLVFDGGGAAIALGLAYLWRVKRGYIKRKTQIWLRHS
jgi:VanZ family protein